ncbi:MAG: hypothetical protein V1746_08025 [bacterium]
MDEKIQLPGDLQETVLLPLFRRRFSTWIHFNNREALPQIEAEAQRALGRLRDLTPQREQGRRLAAGGF